ncbi:MAG TPA: glycosyltransferase family 39 protein [Vicinamibacterales bacterium]|nr:glycosyltransferase family 39 protein [Vicinamibacterales bacterium]
MRLIQLLVAASALLLFLGLDASTIWDANEAYYVETPRQMVQSGDYVNPSFNGAPRFNKPVLSYWVVAAFYKVFGVSVWAERVAIAIGALGIAAAAFVIARVAWSLRAAWIAALVMLSAPRVVFFARRIFIDVWITMFMSLVLMFFVLAEARPHHRRRYLLLMYAAAGLGVLTKGPVALVLPALAFGVYLLVERRLRDIPRMHLVSGALIVLAIVAPWYAMVYAEHGWTYIRDFFIGENLGRYSDTYGQQARPVYFYVPVLLTELFPWSLFVPVALWAGWHRARAGSHLERLLLAWIAVIVLVFTFSSTKQDLYIFPIAAALAALIAGLLDRAIDGEQPAATQAFWTWPVIAAVMLLFWAGLQWLFGVEASRYYIRGAFVAGLLLAAGAAVLFVLWWKRRHLFAIAALGISFVAVNYTLVLIALPDFERFKPVAPLSAAARARHPDARVVQYRVALPSMVWYLGRPVEEVLDEPVLRDRLARDGETLVLLKEGDYPAVQALAPTCIIDRKPLLDVKLREIMAGTALPEMLLVSNRCEE